MSGWQDVLDEQLGLMRFWRSERGQATGYGFGTAIQATDREYYGAEYSGGRDELMENIASIEFGCLSVADPFYIDDEMMDVVEAAAEGFQPEPFRPTDLLSPQMFIVLPRPLFMLDQHSRLISYRAILLSSTAFEVGGPEDQRAGVVLSLYSHALDVDEGLMQPSDEERAEYITVNRTPYVLMHVTPWEFDNVYPGDAPGIALWWRQIQALLRLSLQTIADRSESKPPRGSARRWKREMHEDKYVTVIRLRRPHSQNEPTGESANYSHRFIVSGHWRNQWFPSLNIHRQIWIGAFVKGPEDKPLLVRRTRAFELVR